MTRTLALLVGCTLAAAGCNSVAGPSSSPAAGVDYSVGGFTGAPTTLAVDADGDYVYTCVDGGGSVCGHSRLEGRLQPAEQAQVQAAVGSPSFRALSGNYQDAMAVCIPEQTLYTIRVARGSATQHVSFWDCGRPPEALGAAIEVFQGVVARIDPARLWP